MTQAAVDTSAFEQKKNDPKPIIQGFLRHVKYTLGRDWQSATPHDLFFAIAYAVRDAIMENLIATQATYHERGVKQAYYLSVEYLLGRLLKNNLVNLNLYDTVAEDLERYGVNLHELCEVEEEPGLGNGGLGRLAACLLDAAATMRLPLTAYGLRYEYGIFQQEIHDGWQVERPDYWLGFGSPWEIVRPELANAVRLYGHVEPRFNSRGEYKPVWRGYRTVLGVPYDVPIVGYGSGTVNILRLWSAHAPESFDLESFNRGGYVEAVREQAECESITKVLYPDDRFPEGKELRLVQQYFFVACSLADIICRHENDHGSLEDLHEKAAIHLNDTHPALAIAELMRILMDERGMKWEPAWEITRRTFSWTNHTLLPEALEVWSVDLLQRVLPRHLEIIYEINQRFLDDVQVRCPNASERVAALSIVQESPFKAIRMANLCIVGSHSVNGVAPLHTELIRTRLVPDFAAMWPEKFNNKTNAVSPRRWLWLCNRGLCELITSRIGPGWITNLDRLRELARFASDGDFLAELRRVKQANKTRFADWVQERHGVALPHDALFDVQVKRLHEYKRQLLNLLQVVLRYQRLCEDPAADLPTRVVVFGAKAAPGYHRAKLIIKLINDVAATVNNDPRVAGRLKVVFLPNYCVSVAERVIPAADLSEQISTAGMEASGTGNMKFALNGALTIGTLDGANVDIRNAVGPENFFLFGMTAEEVARRRPGYSPWEIYNSRGEIRGVLDAIASGVFNPRYPDLYKPIVDSLTHHGDHYMILADLVSYLQVHEQVDALWRNPPEWDRRAALNIAGAGYFSSDRLIREYAEEIWRIRPTPPEPELAIEPAPVRAPRRPRKTDGSTPRRSGAAKKGPQKKE